MVALAALLAVAVLVAQPEAGTRPAASASPAQSVTFSFVRFFDVACNCFKARVSGRVSNGRSGKHVVTVSTPDFNPVNLKGRQIVLQRRVGGRWARVATARLAPHRTRFYSFTAGFTVPRRGWILRALVSSNAAALCFAAAASERWTS
jgi:hypothetical protein